MGSTTGENGSSAPRCSSSSADAAHQCEWELFNVPGGIAFFLGFNFAALVLLLMGLVEVVRGSARTHAFVLSRWALRIIWEFREAPMTFRALQGACAVAPSVLNTRLAELRAADIVAIGDEGYTLSSRGRALLEALKPLWTWAESWPGRGARSRSPAARSGGR